ncbi:hypothetical protein SAMN05443247_00577 [Bradyrhizobium erythrophlei]|jgi:hypothetical protein|nr:hypothetical protein SAMN05443247_00577 [Bradyrhizobium erythrophlei]
MLMRIVVALASLVAFGTSQGWADAYKAPKNYTRHHRHAHVVRYQQQPVAPVPYDGPTLVLHPAQNIACDTPFRATRALPCDQPVWVYGSPCERDLGLGRYRSCDGR